MICHECGQEIDDSTKKCPTCRTVLKETGTFFDKLAKLEAILLSTCLGLMVFMVLYQIILRNFFSTGILGGDSIVRHMLLWVGFLGAGLATKGGVHIRIDIASKVLSTKGMQVAQIFTDMFSVIISGLLVYASFNFVKLGYETADKLLFMDIPVWFMESIIPVGFLIMTLRFASKGVENFQSLIKES